MGSEYLQVEVIMKEGAGGKSVPDEFVLVGKSYPVDRVKKKKLYRLFDGTASVQYEIVSYGRNYLLRCEVPEKQIWSISPGSYMKESSLTSPEEQDLQERSQSIREILEQQ